MLLDWPEQGMPAPVRTWVAGRGGYSALPEFVAMDGVLV
jgi:hypothetical protein